MKKRLIGIFLIGIIGLVGLCACGLSLPSEKPVTGRYYLAVLPDKHGKNTVERVEDVTLRIKAGGVLIRTEKGEEQEGSWELSGRSITLKLGREEKSGRITEDRIEIGDAVYIRGLKEAREFWQADADSYVADPLAAYEGKYYLAGCLEDGDNRVQDLEDETLWLMPENEALLFVKGRLSLLSWELSGDSVLLQKEEGRLTLRFENGRLSGEDQESLLVWFRDQDEAERYLKEHPFVPKPHVPVRSGLEGEYYLAYATAFGKAVDIGRAGAVHISLMPDWIMYYDGALYSEEGSYALTEDGRIVLDSASGALTGTARDGCLDLKDAGGDSFLFFDSLEKAAAYYEAYKKTIGPGENQVRPPETEPVPTAEEPETAPESTADQPESAEAAAFWSGTWYGLVRLTNECSGLYRLMRGKCYTVYVVLDVKADGTGTLTAYDPAETFAEKLLVGKVRCGEGKTLILTEGKIEAFDVTVGDFTAAYDEARRLVSFSLSQSISGGTIGGELLLRPWGEGWEDQPEIMKLLPDYEAYLEEIKTGTPRYTAD